MQSMSQGRPVRSSAEPMDRREPDQAPDAAAAARCTACTGGALAPETVNSAFWDAGRLVVVEDVPALVCQSCGERYFEDETAMKLDLIRGAGFPDGEAVRHMNVPVFSFAPKTGAGKRG